MFNRVLRLVGITAVMIGIASCGSSKPSSYYLLNDLTNSHVRVQHGAHKTIGVGPVEMAKYLNQPQIVTRDNLNKVHLDEFNRWAEPLDDNFTRVLSKNLQNNLSSEHIVSYPWQHSDAIDYQVKVEVYRFDATKSGKIVCDIRYEIIKTDTKAPIFSKSRIYREFLDEKYSYSQLAYCMSRILANISRDLAHDLRLTTRKLPHP